jgi:tetratricopeptide (TPR) repeat protein
MSWKRAIIGFAVACGMAAPLAADWKSGVTAFKTGDLATAEAEFRALTQAQPEWAGGHLMLGQTLLRAGRAEEALPSLEQARELAPDDPQTALALGQAHVNLERFDDAAGVLSGVEPEPLPEPQKLAFYRTRALAAVRTGRQSDAIPDLERALELTPDGELHRLLAHAAREAGSSELAITHYGRALELDPQDVGSLRALVQLLYDQALAADPGERADLCQTVLPHARRLVKLEDTYEHLVLLAESARCVGLDEEALRLLDTAAAKRPNDWWPLQAIGRTWMGLENWDEAEAAFLRALDKGVPAEETAEIRQQLGYVYERQQRLEAALSQYRLAGDEGGVARVEENLIAQKEAEAFEKLAAEKKRLEEELRRIERKGEGGGSVR